MDAIVNKYQHGRRAMIDAFVELSRLARRAGVTEDEFTALHGRFFDGNVELRHAFGALLLLVKVWRPRRIRSENR